MSLGFGRMDRSFSTSTTGCAGAGKGLREPFRAWWLEEISEEQGLPVLKRLGGGWWRAESGGVKSTSTPSQMPLPT